MDQAHLSTRSMWNLRERLVGVCDVVALLKYCFFQADLSVGLAFVQFTKV